MRQAENEFLTRVGPGTPAGELLRRYWHPVSIAGELTEQNPTKRVMLLGEKLVVFRMPLAPGETQPRYGLVAEQCRHRLASLFYGRVEADGDQVTLTNARCIRKWGTKQGLGQLVGGPTAQTILDPAGTVRLHVLAVVATYDASEDGWKAALA